MKSTSFGSRFVRSAARSPGRSSTGPDVWRRFTPSSLATMCASVVLPSPGGPKSSTWSSASLRPRAAAMKISSCARTFSCPTYSASVDGRSERSNCSSCGDAGRAAIIRSGSMLTGPDSARADSHDLLEAELQADGEQLDLELIRALPLGARGPLGGEKVAHSDAVMELGFVALARARGGCLLLGHQQSGLPEHRELRRELEPAHRGDPEARLVSRYRADTGYGAADLAPVYVGCFRTKVAVEAVATKNFPGRGAVVTAEDERRRNAPILERCLTKRAADIEAAFLGRRRG